MRTYAKLINPRHMRARFEAIGYCTVAKCADQGRIFNIVDVDVRTRACSLELERAAAACSQWKFITV